MACLEKGMTGFHEYMPQRPHAEIRISIGRKICATQAETPGASPELTALVSLQTCSQHSLVLRILSFLVVWYLHDLHSCQLSVIIILRVVNKILLFQSQSPAYTPPKK